jgi:hypothetical protein
VCSIDFASISTIFWLDFGMWYLYCFFFNNTTYLCVNDNWSLNKNNKFQMLLILGNCMGGVMVRFSIHMWYFYSATSLHWNNSLQVDMLLHSDTLSRFWGNQSFLLIVACLVKKQQIQFFVLGLQLTIYHMWIENANHYTTHAVT